jgi:hypothetical protein
MTSAPRSPYAGYRFPAEIVSHAVWLYAVWLYHVFGLDL